MCRVTFKNDQKLNYEKKLILFLCVVANVLSKFTAKIASWNEVVDEI
jgi:hypothetical protein